MMNQPVAAMQPSLTRGIAEIEMSEVQQQTLKCIYRKNVLTACAWR